MTDRYNTLSKCYVCKHHDFKEVFKVASVKLSNSTKVNVNYKLLAPSGAGPDNESKTISRGMGRDCEMRTMLLTAFHGNKDKTNYTEWAMCAQAMAEETYLDTVRVLNTSVADVVNLHMKKGNANNFVDSNGSLF